LAVGVRFSELATGSYGMKVPEKLIHVDINLEVFNQNYPAKVTIEGDSKQVLQAIIAELEKRGRKEPVDYKELAENIRKDKEKYMKTWQKEAKENIVSPGFFFNALRNMLKDDAIVVTDDGNHTFLTAELFPVRQPRCFISPTDFNCMGYGVPAAIATKMMNMHKQVIGIVGDGAFMMTGMEMVTAFTYKLGLVIFVFHDGELGQISQFQEIPLNRKTASIIGQINIKGIADAVHAKYMVLMNDVDINGVLNDAFELAAQKKNVIVDVNIDYTKKTLLTTGVVGVVKTNLSRFPVSEKIKMLLRAGKRHILG